ncbi:MAG: response regulator transcription factor [Verrucomicrobia bacterium]|nr:response regulator transcription factor [Verrucomicrobiota bacterium]
MKKVLIIEDERHTRENLCTILEMEGYLPLSAADGETGLATALRENPDLILCDVTMPKLDGFGVLAALRQRERGDTIPFIFLSARSDRPDVRAGMNLGADDYLTKPASAEEVLSAVETRLIRHQRMQGKGGAPDFSSSLPLESLGLTPREAEVLLWVAQGKTNADVATILGMSDKTVKIHLSHIFEKLSVETRTAAAMVAMERLV